MDRSRRVADDWASTTDPDASPLRRIGGRSALGDHDHDVVDGGRARIILTARVTPAEVQDNQPAVDLLWHARFRWKLRLRQVAGDRTYGTVANIVAIEREGIHASVPRSEAGQRAGVFGAQDFRDDPAADRSSGPGETTRRFRSQSEATHRRIDQASAADCRACALREGGTTSPRGRRISRSLDEDAIDRVRKHHATEADAKAMRTRKVWIEPLFAEAKDWHGLRRFRLRGLEQVTSQAQVIAAGQHRKRLLSACGWGRRPGPGGVAWAVLPATTPAPVAPA